MGASAGEGGDDDFLDYLDMLEVRDMQGSVARSLDRALPETSRSANKVPSDSMVSAFVCVAKLKLCRLAQAQRAVEAQEDSVAASIMRALDASGSGYVSAHDVQKYLQEHADLKNLSVEDFNLFMGDSCIHVDDAAGDESYWDTSSDGEDGNGAGSFDGFKLLLDQTALRQLLSKPAHHNLASALHRFVQVQPLVTSRQAIKNATTSGGGVAPTSRSYLPEVQGGTLNLDAASAASQEASSGLLFAAEATQKLPRGFGKAALQVWFEELDLNRDGYVTARDVSFWCATASCQSLVDEADLESLFHPSLPDFSGAPAAGTSGPRLAGDFTGPASLSGGRLPTFGASALVQGDLFGDGQLFTFESDGEFKDENSQLDRQLTAIPRPTAVFAGASPQEDNEESAQRSKMLTDEKYASLIEAVQSTSPVQGGLTKASLASALARRPLLAARLALMHRMNRATQATLLAKASATSALSAAANAATMAKWAASVPETAPERERVVLVAENAAISAKRAATQATEASAAALAACSSGQSRNSGVDLHEDAAVRELEVLLLQTGDPHSETAAATRRALHAQRAKGWQRSLAILSMEVALEVKLLAWREAEHYSQQVQELRVFLPLRAAAQLPLSGADVFDMEEDDEEEEEEKAIDESTEQQNVSVRLQSRLEDKKRKTQKVRGLQRDAALNDQDKSSSNAMNAVKKKAPAPNVITRASARKSSFANTSRTRLPPPSRPGSKAASSINSSTTSFTKPVRRSPDRNHDDDGDDDSNSDVSSEASFSSSSSSSASEPEEEESSSESSSEDEECEDVVVNTTKKAAPAMAHPEAVMAPKSVSQSEESPTEVPPSHPKSVSTISGAVARKKTPRQPPPRPVVSRDRQVSNRPKPVSPKPPGGDVGGESSLGPRHSAL